MKHSKLIRMLRHANAAEHGAYWAYVGHHNSLRDQLERFKLSEILAHELLHIQVTNEMLEELGSVPDSLLVSVYTFIGQVLGALCHVFGHRLPMRIAGLIEKWGANGYRKISFEARRTDKFYMAMHLIELAQVEDEHEKYFRSVS